MDLKNQQVIHKTLGNGIIVSQDDQYIIVEFASKTSKFMYPNPDTFGKFLTLVDPAIHSAVFKEAEDARNSAENACIQAETEKRRAEEATRAAEQTCHEAETTARKSSRTTSPTKPIAAKAERIPGKSMTFYVFQGNTFDIERVGGFLWAPQHSQSGGRVFHWDNMLLVKEGDIVLHGCNGYVVAVSIAVSNCYDCGRPEECTFEDSWNHDGRRVDLKYATFLNPIKTSDFAHAILEHCKVKYSPFDKNGNGNMGYLYELNRELARIFLRAAVRSNPYLSDLDYVQSLLAEETA